MAIETQVNGDSPQAIALRLMEIVARKEGKLLDVPESQVDRKYILSTYRECLQAVLGDYLRWGPFSS
jgi:hypothetical protein